MMSRLQTMERRTILVTGADGALARHVIAQLAPHHDVVATDFRRQAEFEQPLLASYRIRPEKREMDDVFRLHRIDTVLHLGRVQTHESDRHRRYTANVMGTRRLLDLALQHGVRQTLIHSSFFVYGASPYNPALLDEEAPLKAAQLTQELVDLVELESLASIQLWKHPKLRICILRPCTILGPGVRNAMSQLLTRSHAPVMTGFSPMMQFLHVEDMAAAIIAALLGDRPGIYNVAPEDWIAYQEAVVQAGCRRVPLPSIPPLLPHLLGQLAPQLAVPSYLVNYLKYPVVIDGRLFRRQFGWQPQHSLNDILAYYREQKPA